MVWVKIKALPVVLILLTNPAQVFAQEPTPEGKRLIATLIRLSTITCGELKAGLASNAQKYEYELMYYTLIVGAASKDIDLNSDDFMNEFMNIFIGSKLECFDDEAKVITTLSSELLP